MKRLLGIGLVLCAFLASPPVAREALGQVDLTHQQETVTDSLKVTGNASIDADAIVGGDVRLTNAGQLEFGSDTALYRYVADGLGTDDNFYFGDALRSQEIFTSGVFGSGWNLNKVNGEWSLELDRLTVRGTLEAFVFKKHVVNVSNAMLLVTDSGKLKEDVESATTVFHVEENTFQPNDIVLAQDEVDDQGWELSIYREIMKVTASAGDSITVQRGRVGSAKPWPGGTVLARVGNTDDPSRRGAILADAGTQFSPFIDVLQFDAWSNIDSTYTNSLTDATPNVKLRLGRLSGIVDPALGLDNTDTFGLYANDVYLKGKVVLQGGSTGWSNLADKPDSLADINADQDTKLGGIEAGATVGADWSVDLSNIPIRFADAPTGQGLYLTGDYMGYYDGGQWQTYIANNGQFYFTGDANNYIAWDGSALSVRGSIYALDGAIGGYTISADSLYGNQVTLSSSKIQTGGGSYGMILDGSSLRAAQDAMQILADNGTGDPHFIRLIDGTWPNQQGIFLYSPMPIRIGDVGHSVYPDPVDLTVSGDLTVGGTLAYGSTSALGTDYHSWTLDKDYSDGDQWLQFQRAASDYAKLKWDETAGRFELYSNGLDKADGTKATLFADLAGDATWAAGASEAAKWSTARTVSLTGDVTGSASVDGSADVNITTTVVNVASHTQGYTTITDEGVGTEGQILAVDNAGGFELAPLGQVGQVLTWTGHGLDWEAGGSAYLSGLSDTDINSPADLDILVWDVNNLQWINAPKDTLGFAADDHEHQYSRLDDASGPADFILVEKAGTRYESYPEDLIDDIGALPTSGGTMTGELRIERAAANRLFSLVDTDGNATTSSAWLEFMYGATPTRLGYVGYGSTGNANMYLYNAVGPVRVYSNNTLAVEFDNSQNAAFQGNISATQGNFSGILNAGAGTNTNTIEGHTKLSGPNGDVHSWFPFTNGNVYISADQITGSGNIIFRKYTGIGSTTTLAEIEADGDLDMKQGNAVFSSSKGVVGTNYNSIIPEHDNLTGLTETTNNVSVASVGHVVLAIDSNNNTTDRSLLIGANSYNPGSWSEIAEFLENGNTTIAGNLSWGGGSAISSSNDVVQFDDLNYYTDADVETFLVSPAIEPGSGGGEYLVNESGALKYRSQSQVLSDIGALPLAGGTMAGTLNFNNNNITEVNALSFNDPGPNEGVSWGASDWRIYSSPNDLTTNTGGNLQFVHNGNRRLTMETGGVLDVPGSIREGGTALSAKYLGINAKADDSDLLDGISSGGFLRSNANDVQTQTLDFSSAANDVIDFTADTSNDARGISFESRTALSADYNDGYLRLNQGGEFTNGVYTPGSMRADGGFVVDGNTVINTTGGTIYEGGTALSAKYAPLSRNLTAGDGLSGGGTLTADRSFAVDSTVLRTTGGQTITGEKAFNGWTTLNYVRQSSFYDRYDSWGGGSDLNWKRVARLYSNSTSGYRGTNMVIWVTDENGNYGQSIPDVYMAKVRVQYSSNSNPTDIASIEGTRGAADRIRLQKLGTRDYEVQVRQPSNWKDMNVRARLIDDTGDGFTWYDLDNGSAGTSTITMGSVEEHFGTVDADQIVGLNTSPGTPPAGEVRIGEGNGQLRVQTDDGYVEIGPRNASNMHFYTDRTQFYFNKEIVIDEGIISSYNEDLQLERAGVQKLTLLNTYADFADYAEMDWLMLRDGQNPGTTTGHGALYMSTGDLYYRDPAGSSYNLMPGGQINLADLGDVVGTTTGNDVLYYDSSRGRYEFTDIASLYPHNHDSRYFTETEVNNLLSGKSDTGHTHDGRYFTESESDSRYINVEEYAHLDEVSITAGNGAGIRFWDSNNYKIYMSSTGDGTWGGRLDSSSDYNMYFKMDGGTNRGFAFKNGSTVKAQIDASGNLYLAGTINTSGQANVGTMVLDSSVGDPGNSKVALGVDNYGQLIVYTDNGYVEIGPSNTGWSHYSTNNAGHWFEQKVATNGDFVLYRPGTGSYDGTLTAGTLTAHRTYTFPNKSGTVAMTSDITGGSTALDDLTDVSTTGAGANDYLGYNMLTEEWEPMEMARNDDFMNLLEQVQMLQDQVLRLQAQVNMLQGRHN